MSDFVHLHNHTHFSLLDGACRIGDLVKQAKQFKMPALAITDHGNMFGTVQFYKEVLKAGMKPILGMEAYIAPESRHDKSKGKSAGVTAYHLILLARNLDGFKNLMKLSSIGYLEGFYYKPRIDKEILEAHSEGLLVLSSCIKGEVPYKIIHGDYDGAKEAALWYKERFGENYYLEVQNHDIPEEEIALKGLIELSKDVEIPLVATNDTHYLKQAHARAQDILLCIQTNKDRDDPNRLRFSTDQIYFKSYEDMAKLFGDIPGCLSNSVEIAEKCHVVLDFDTLHLPHFHIPEEEGVYSLDEYLEIKARHGIKHRFPEPTPEIEERLAYEIGIIERMGYAGYFLIVADFIEEARKKGIPVGPGRGSAAGSLVSYALGITNVDPMKYSLLFERFLNPERVSMPDIDIDFCYERRDEIIDYVKKKYGDKNVTQIITFGSMNARAVVRDVGRVLKIPYGEVDQFAKAIPMGSNLMEAQKKVPKIKELLDQSDLYREMWEYSLVLEGLARHASIHAAGVVIAPGDLTQYVPLSKSTQDDVTTQFDMKSLESMGLLKMDFLGLRTLTVIDHAISMLKDRGIEVNIDDIPLDDEQTYRIFGNGETVGIFQFESAGMRDYLRKLQPGSIGDLTAMNALYRPGPMEFIDDFIDRKHGRTKVAYPHPLLEPILKETHGIIVYQEQVMQIASAMGGFNLGKADLLRRAMGKKNPELMQQQRIAFLEGSKEKKIDKNTANDVFELIDKFAGYGFNKSHAACYSVVAYQTAYLKAHYPLEFMAANLTSEMGNTDRVVILIEECRRMGIEILPPDVNSSFANFVVSDGKIRFGLGAVKNVGRTAIESMVEGRENQGCFKTIYDFCQSVNLRLVNKKVVESLIQVGALDSVEGNRAQKLAVLEKCLSLAQAAQSAAASGQYSIFGEESTDTPMYPELPAIEPWSHAETLRREKELLGFYISGHPLSKYKDEVNAFSSPMVGHLGDISPGKNVRVCGIITNLSTKFDRKDNLMAFFNVEDFTGTVRIIAFSDTYEKYSSQIQEDEMVVICGKLDRRSETDDSSILANDIISLCEAREKLSKRLALNIESKALENEEMDKVQSRLRKYPGKCNLYFNIKTETGEEFLMRSKKFQVNPTADLVTDLRTLLGEENVWIEG